MIQYTLKCDQGHQTESWFKSSEAYDALDRAGHLACAICGSAEVKKALMAPRVRHGKDAQAEAAPVLKNPSTEVERMINELREKVETTSDYVGDAFASEARAMHLGDKPERSIYGQARPDQAKELLEDGVPVLPLPFQPKKKLA